MERYIEKTASSLLSDVCERLAMASTRNASHSTRSASMEEEVHIPGMVEGMSKFHRVVSFPQRSVLISGYPYSDLIEESATLDWPVRMSWKSTRKIRKL
jgi:hypothetical protein